MGEVLNDEVRTQPGGVGSDADENGWSERGRAATSVDEVARL
jgi:hypothetical protein